MTLFLLKFVFAICVTLIFVIVLWLLERNGDQP